MTLPTSPLLGSKRAYWACQIAGWYGYGTAQLIAAHFIGATPTLRIGIELFVLYSAAIGASHWVRGYMRRHRWDAFGPLALTPRVVLMAVTLSLPFGIAQSFTSFDEMNPQPGMPHPVRAALDCSNWTGAFATWMALYFIILGARQRRYAELRQSELARELQGAELRLLKSQLNPHFLFNSLNSVRALIADDPARAQHAVTQLARTLRYTLGSAQEELVTLERELELVDDYLGLESLRLAERLRIERDISTDALRARIPTMLLQTVVENAIKHGIAELPDGGVLRIGAKVQSGVLHLDVENPRPTAPAQRTAEGVGLRNGAERLRLLFGQGATLDLDLADAERATARIRIPVSP